MGMVDKQFYFNILLYAVTTFVIGTGSLYGQVDLLTNGDFEGGFYLDSTPLSPVDSPTEGDDVPNGWTKYENFSGGGDEYSERWV